MKAFVLLALIAMVFAQSVKYPILLNGFTNDGDRACANYFKQDAITYIEGYVHRDSNNGSTIFVLPDAYAPYYRTRFQVASDDAAIWIEVETDGSVTVASAWSSGWISLSGISFSSRPELQVTYPTLMNGFQNYQNHSRVSYYIEDNVMYMDGYAYIANGTESVGKVVFLIPREYVPLFRTRIQVAAAGVSSLWVEVLARSGCTSDTSKSCVIIAWDQTWSGGWISFAGVSYVRSITSSPTTSATPTPTPYRTTTASPWPYTTRASYTTTAAPTYAPSPITTTVPSYTVPRVPTTTSSPWPNNTPAPTTTTTTVAPTLPSPIQFIYATYQNGWRKYPTDNDPQFVGARFYKADGRVYLDGTVIGSAVNVPMFTLPPGYRPEYGSIFRAAAQVTLINSIRITILQNGIVKVEIDTVNEPWSGGWVSLAGISFVAAQVAPATTVSPYCWDCASGLVPNWSIQGYTGNDRCACVRNPNYFYATPTPTSVIPILLEDKTPTQNVNTNASSSATTLSIGFVAVLCIVSLLF
jgi:hypothetical protein